MTQDWTNAETAKQWDKEGHERNPLRSEQLDVLVSILADQFTPGHWILDLGYGSGQVEQLIFDRIPGASVVGVDFSEAMMTLAAERLKAYPNRFEAVQHNLSELDSLQLPNHPYQFVIAIQSLHHLLAPQLRAAYEYVYNTLPPGGMFLLLDRLAVESERIWQVMHVVWERQDRLFHTHVSSHEGESFDAHARRVRERGDFPISLYQHLTWLKECGFDATCVHVHGNRGLLVGVKP